MSCHVLLLSTDSQVPMCGEEEGTWGQGCRVCEVSEKTFLSSLFYLNIVIMHYFFCRGGSRLDNPFGSCSLGCSRCGFDYSCGQLLLFLENVSELLEINGRLKTYRLREEGEGKGEDWFLGRRDWIFWTSHKTFWSKTSECKSRSLCFQSLTSSVSLITG